MTVHTNQGDQLAQELLDCAHQEIPWAKGPVQGSTIVRAVRLGRRQLEENGGSRLRFRGESEEQPLKIEGPVRLNSLRTLLALSFEHCHFDSKIDLSAAELGQLRFEHCMLKEMELSDLGTSGLLSLQCCQIEGPVTLMDARIDGMLAMESTSIVGGRKRADRTAQIIGDDTDLYYALDARNLIVKGSVNLSPMTKASKPFSALGKVSFRSAEVDGHLNMQSAQFDAHGAKTALDLNGVWVGKTVYFNLRASARGLVDMRGAAIGSQLNMRDATLYSADAANMPIVHDDATDPDERVDKHVKVALHANGMQISRQLLIARTEIHGDVILTGASCAELWDAYLDHHDAKTKRNWHYPSTGRLWLHGFVYDRINSVCVVNAKDRLAWLKAKTPRGHQQGFSPQPYTQLANVMASMGHDRWARQVYLAREQARRGSARIRNRLSGWVYNVLVGSGYQPWRGVFWLLCLVATGALVFAHHARTGGLVPSETYALYQLQSAAGLPPGYTCPNPWVYSLDVALPIVDLKQEHYWKASPSSVPGLCETVSALPWNLDLRMSEWIRDHFGAAMARLAPYRPEWVSTPSWVQSLWPLSWVRAWYWIQVLTGALLVALTGLSFSGILKRD